MTHWSEWTDTELLYLSDLIRVAYLEGIGGSGDPGSDEQLELSLIAELDRRGLPAPQWAGEHADAGQPTLEGPA